MKPAAFVAILGLLFSALTPRAIQAAVPPPSTAANEPLTFLLDAPLLFVKRHSYTGIHIYDTYYKWPPGGGGIYLLENPSAPRAQWKIRPIIDPTTPKTLGIGVYSHPELSWDARKLLFCFKGEPQGNTSIYEIGIDGQGLRRITDPGPTCASYRGSQSGQHDTAPAYLPDDRIVFLSTRPSGLVPCNNTGVATLHVTNADGSDLHPISVNYVNEFDPAVLPDGRILFGRWEYVDKNALTIQSLWTINPDGTQETALYANNMVFPEATLDARPVPGSSLIVATLAKHNAPPRGSIGFIDPRGGKNDPNAITNLEHPEEPTFDRGDSCEPWPLSKDAVIFSGRPPGAKRNTIEMMDRAGHRFTLLEDPEICLHSPMLVKPRAKPVVVPTMIDRAATSGRFFVQDIYQGLDGVRRGEVKWLRVIEETSRVSASTMGGSPYNQTFLVSAALAFSAKCYLGVVPVSEDGSAYFEAPAGRALYLQALDADGRLVQSMRSFVQAAPGTTRSCVGCHEHKSGAPPADHRAVDLLAREPSRLQPESWGSGYLDYPSMTQPILDRNCVSCHGGEKGIAAGMDLTGGWTEHFSISYENLVSRRETQLVAYWIAGIDCMNGTAFWSSQIFPPRGHGSGAAPLAKLLLEGHSGYLTNLARPERDLLMAWMDSNGLYHGSWDSTASGCAIKNWKPTRDALVAEMQKADCMRCHGDEQGKPLLFEEDWVNLQTPELSRVLRAPLGISQPGYGLGLCRERKVDPRRQRVRQLVNGYAHAVQPIAAFKPRQFVPPDLSGVAVASFASAGDPYYQAMLAIIREARQVALADPRVDLPGAKIIPGQSRQFVPLALPKTLPTLRAELPSSGGVRLSWDRRAELSGLTFELHRDHQQDFAPSEATRIASTTLFDFLDASAPPDTPQYALVLVAGDRRSEPVRATVSLAEAQRVAELARAAHDANAVQAVRSLYLRSRAAEEAVEELQRFNFKALRLAITDLLKTFGAKYPQGAQYLARLDRLERSFSVGSTGDSPVPSGDPPDETANGVGWETGVLVGDARTPVPSGESPGGSPAPPTPNRYKGEGQGEWKETVRTSDAVLHSRRASELAGGFLSQVAELRSLFREALLANPLLDFDKLLLVRRRADHLGLPQNWQGNSSLPRSGFDNEMAVLSPVTPDGQLSRLHKPDGDRFVGDLKLHFDADRLLFSSIGSHNRWQVFELVLSSAATCVVRQVTPGDQPDVDNYDPCYLPDGRILFCSTAGFIGVPCVDGSDHVANLYQLQTDDRTIRQLTFDQDHDWSPTVLNDGRVLYQRWEYADTPHAMTRLLFQMNPDGTGQAEFYGSSSYWPNAMFYARPVPGHPTKVAAIVSGHHGVPRMGELVIFDPSRGRAEAEGAVQRIPGHGQRVEAITRDQLVDASWPKFLHPFPLSENYFLVSAKPAPDAFWGIYLADVFDNLLLLAELPGQALLEPTPLRKTARPPVIPDRVDPERKDALVYVSDIYQGDGLKGVPRGTVKALRVFAYHWAYQGMGGLLGTIGLDGPWDVRRILGTVPVEEDGSAYFRVPANTPISVQPLDAEGKALQLMRSWFTAMPGENLSCVGCHERQNHAPARRQASAFVGRQPSEIDPWHGPARGFSYKREVQPIIDRYCVECHDGQAGSNRTKSFDLRGSEYICDFRMVTPGHAGRHGGKFSVGYANLHRYVRRPGIESDYHLLTPLEYHADTTELIQLLRKGHFGVELDSEGWDRLITWIDLNAPYHGNWSEEIANPGRQIERRRELRMLYAGMEDEDAEVIPAPVAADVRKLTSPGGARPFTMARATGEISIPGKSTPTTESAEQSAHSKRSRGFERASPQARASAEDRCAQEEQSLLTSAATVDGWPFDADEAARRQTAAGARSKLTLSLGSGVSLELIRIPAGEFIMGDADATPDEQPLTRVRIPHSFWMASTEVSNEQFAQFDPAHDSHVESKTAYQFGVHGYPVNEPAQPAVRVSWDQAIAFCRWLSQKSGRRIKLPSEAQWEWACRAGSAQSFSFGGVAADFSKFANLADAKLTEFASDPYTVFTPLKDPSQYEDYIPKDPRFNDGGLVSRPVGRYAPNAWGLHDMHGNVWEWTRTNYRPYPYRGDDGGNTLDSSEKKVARGGSWRDRSHRATAAYRLAYEPWQRVFNVGFRVVCEDEGTGSERAQR